MGGFADVLGNVAGGFTEAANRETNRQFQGEMDRRQQIVGLLGKLAADDTAHPEVRNNAFNMALEALHSPHTKQFKPDFNKLIVPGASSGQNVGAVPGLAPDETAKPQATSGQGTTTSAAPQLQAPPQPPSNLYYTPEEQTAQAASKAGATTAATAGAQMASPIYQSNGQGGYTAVPISHAGTKMGEGIPNAIPPGIFAVARTNMQGVDYMGQNGEPLHGQVDKNGLYGPKGAVYDQTGQLVPNAVEYKQGNVQKTTTGATTDPFGFTTTSKKTTGPAKPTGGTAKPQLQQPPTMPGTAQQPAADTGTATAKSKAAAPVDIHQPSSVIRSMFSSMTPGARDVVASTMDRMMDTGVKPGEKFNKVQQAAFAALNKQGLTPPMQATEQTRTKADAAKQALTLVADARRLIQQDPSALGPLSGRWSQLEQKYGNLEGTPKELAGTLKSLYSIAGSMHGWRAIRVADEFEKTYGGIQNTPASLMAGLNAMESTAHAVMGSVPGMDKGGQNGLQTPAGPPSGNSGTIFARDQNGQLHKAPAGTKLPEGWKVEPR